MRTTAILAAMLIAASTLLAQRIDNDSGGIYTDGLTFQVRRDTRLPYEPTHTSRNDYYRQAKYFMHGVRPNGDIGTLVLGRVRMNVFNPPCSPIPPDQVVRGVFKLALSFRVDAVDSVNDWASVPLAESPHVAIQPIGYTDRTFFSAAGRPQGNGWDGFVEALNSQLLPGDPFIIRFEPDSGAGFMFDDRGSWFTIAASADPADPDLLDGGLPGITYLGTAEGFHGLVVRGSMTRVPWTNQPPRFSFYRSDGTLVYIKEVTPAWGEDQTRRELLLGLTDQFLAANPLLTIVANERPEEEVTLCRVDSIRVRYQP